ncbi:MAG: hypothetical protein QOD06_766 [Candidatus Binatota bacterium]|nr:hypothetical protein [Candidatus Binatota bacterium]
MRIAILGAVLALVCSSMEVPAQTAAPLLCCGTKTCPDGRTQVGAERCCVNPQDPSTCTQVANLGKRCDDDLAAAVTGAPGRRNVAGCAEQPGVACIGGEIGDDSGIVAGCVCVGDACEADVDFPNGKQACTRIAVDACCAADACR